jgi:antitoxin YefM
MGHSVLAEHNFAYFKTYDTFSQEHDMQTLTASEARANLYRLMDQAAQPHEPITISDKRHDAVLLAAKDWDAIQETLYLLSIQGMRESIKKGLAQPAVSCAKELDW